MFALLREQGTFLSQGNSKVVESVSFSRWHSLYPWRPALIKDDYRWWKEIPWLERALGWAWGASDGTVQHGQWQLRWWSHQTTSFSLWFFKDVSLRPLGECRDLNLKGNLAFKTFNAQVLCSPPAKSCSLPGCHPARKSRMSVLLFPCQWQMSLKKREIKLIRGEAVSQFLGLNLQELTPRVWEVELLCGFSWFLWGWPMDNAGGTNRLFVNNEEKTCGVMIYCFCLPDTWWFNAGTYNGETVPKAPASIWVGFCQNISAQYTHNWLWAWTVLISLFFRM